MARIEARAIADYGLPWRRMFGRQFWQGAVVAFVCLTAFLIASRIAGVFRFGEIALHGSEIWKWGALYGFGFMIVALEEEFHYRGYALYTLTKGIGFWHAAILLSAAFGYSHIGNSGETWLGAFNASAGGLLFCLLLRRSGNLWLPIGFHASWDWTQTYFYGIPDSGTHPAGASLQWKFRRTKMADWWLCRSGRECASYFIARPVLAGRFSMAAGDALPCAARCGCPSATECRSVKK